ncbi:penicillin acylase family protein [bacterium]|nr:penicillin acylase family protein [bacterium]
MVLVLVIVGQGGEQGVQLNDSYGGGGGSWYMGYGLFCERIFGPSKAYELLKKWDGYMPIGSKGASIFQLTIYHVLKAALEPTLGKDYFRIYMNNLDHWDFFKNFIFKKIVPFQAGLIVEIMNEDGTMARFKY